MTAEAGMVQRPALPALQQTAETAAMVLAAQARALVEARFTIAMRRPRDLDVVRQKILKECERPSFAEVAIYRKPIGGKALEGPSIRFAEAALQILGNIAVDTPAIYDDPEKRILRVTVADMETNVTHSKDVTIHKTVERRQVQEGDEVVRMRQNKQGVTLYVRRATDDEILNTENALVSKALRTTGLRLVPGWLIDECMEAVHRTRAKGDQADPDAAKRKLFDAFGAIGISAEALKQWLGHQGEQLQPRELEELRGVYTAIRDGEVTWKEVMDARWQESVAAMDANAKAAATKTAPLKERIKAAAERGQTKPASAPPPTEQDFAEDLENEAALRAALAAGEKTPR